MADMARIAMSESDDVSCPIAGKNGNVIFLEYESLTTMSNTDWTDYSVWYF